MPVLPLVVRGLRVTFAGVRAVDGVDLDVATGTIVGLVGPNGCGKTTTLRAVLGLVPAAGSVRVDGVTGGTIAARARVSWAPDEPAGLDELSVDELLALVAALWRAREDLFARRAGVLLDAFGLSPRRGHQLGALSHGQRRLAAIVAAVALDRALLLVDEATAALDPEAVVVLREVLRSVAAGGRGVLVASQDLNFAESVCDRVVLLHAGRVAAEGTLDALRSRYAAATLEDAFLRALGSHGRFEEIRRALDRL